MGIPGYLWDFKDYASKMAENTARVAALLHYFSNDADSISINTINAAIEIITWYMDQHIQLFSKSQPLVVLEVDELYNWIVEHCNKLVLVYVRKTTYYNMVLLGFGCGVN